MTRTLSAAEPCSITLLDGKEREFLLRKRGVKVLLNEFREQFKLETVSDLFNKVPNFDFIGSLLIHSQIVNDESLRVTPDNVDDLVPISAEWVNKAVLLVAGASLPDPDPNQAGPVTQAQ